MQKKIVGQKFENLAVNYLKNKGYTILKQNYRNTLGEIDIIAKDADYLVFVEVKYRTSLKFGRPAEAVSFYKQNKIRQVATLYLKSKKMLNSLVRFDCIEILNDEINHIIDAF